MQSHCYLFIYQESLKCSYLLSSQMALLEEDLMFHSSIPVPLDIMVAVVYTIFGEYNTQIQTQFVIPVEMIKG